MKRLFSILLCLALVTALTACEDSSCESIELNKYEITLTEVGDTFGLKVTTDPKDTSDDIEFESSNEDVATVSRRGLITAVGEGHATITVICGDETEYCEVVCEFDSSAPSNNEGSDTEPTDNKSDNLDSTEPTEPEPTEPPEPEYVDCKACGGDGICNNCGGDPFCDDCGGSGYCARCDGVDDILCPDCHGTPPECENCGGDGKVTYGSGSSGEHQCMYCDGTGEYCTTCKYKEGYIDCPDCDDGDCPTCDGRMYTCNKCNNGSCEKCGGEGKVSNTGNTGTTGNGGNTGNTGNTGNSGNTGNYDDCPYCTDGLCSYCDFGICKNMYCYMGKVMCNSCSGSGDCSSCYGLGENIYSGSDCSKCTDGDCRSCGGEGEVTCSTCNGAYYCDRCDNGECPYCDGLGYFMD